MRLIFFICFHMEQNTCKLNVEYNGYLLILSDMKLNLSCVNFIQFYSSLEGLINE